MAEDTPEQSISIMIVDDEFAIREPISDHLAEMGYNVQSYADGNECLKAFEASATDIAIVDVRMPGINGLTVLSRIKELSPATEVIIITAYADKDIAIEALRQGAYDFFEKPIGLDQLAETIKRTARYQAALRERDMLAQQLSMITEQEAQRWGIKGFVGQSPTIQKILSEIRKLQAADATTVLIQGESGTGKELIARAIHFGSSRSSRPFVPVNCPTIPNQLAESTLFGHIRGAFTGANKSRKGYFELADSGTLFLDEISDLPLELQPKLLRTLEEGTFMTVGGGSEVQTNVRILAATNADLRAKTQQGLFREDLYFRLARFTVKIPSLRERREDIPLLANHFVKMFASEMNILSGESAETEKEKADNPMSPNFRVPELSSEALETLMNYHFPGNIRELKNIIERALIESNGRDIKPIHLHFIDSTTTPIEETGSTTSPLHLAHLTPEQHEVLVIKGALVQTDGNIEAAAHLLKISPDRIRESLEGAYPESVDTSESNSANIQSLIMEYVKAHGSITNAECRKLIAIERHQISYILDKMQKAGLLTRQGSHRGTRYYLR